MTLESPAFVIAAAEHSAPLFRQTIASLMSGTGVVNSGDLAVTQQGPPAMGVTVAPGLVWIPGTLGSTTGMGSNAGAQSSLANTNGGGATVTGFPTSFTAQSNYLAYQDGSVNLALSSADPTNPRICLIVATVQDAEYTGSLNQCVLQVVTGAAAGTPVPPVPPANSVVLATVWVPAAAASISTGDINDYRPRALAGLPVPLAPPFYLSGTLAARASISGLVAGTFYEVTDATPPVLDEYNGTVWKTLVTADVAALYLSGTLSARPAAPAAGTFYYATDTGLLYEYNGTAWQTVMLAGAWVGLGLGTYVANASTYNPARIRQEGDIARLSGTIENGSGVTITAGSTIVTGIPSALKPGANIDLTTTIALGGTVGGVQLGMNSGGTQIVLSGSSTGWPAGYFMALEGLTYPLS